MGYSAYILLSLVNIPENLKTLKYEDMQKILTEEYFPKFKQTYEELKHRNFYSLIGPVNHICSGAAWKILEMFDKEIMLFTSKHPEFTFGIYFFYSDLTCLDYWTVKNDKILDKSGFCTESEDEYGGTILKKITMDTDIINIPHNITEFINDKYKNHYDVEFNFT